LKIGLLFGSLNPVHTGHLIIATLLKEKANLDEVWLIVSPLNPFKQNADLAEEGHRLEMVKLAVGDTPFMKVMDIEFSLPKPSYTHRTLKELAVQYPESQFLLLIGEDNLLAFDEWKEASWIKKHYSIIVYGRTLETAGKTESTFYIRYDLPLIDISSTQIRRRIKNHLPIRYFVTPDVERYIEFHKLYREK
jgi:nicotinate-nucleotide adenylyltransferase